MAFAYIALGIPAVLLWWNIVLHLRRLGPARGPSPAAARRGPVALAGARSPWALAPEADEAA